MSLSAATATTEIYTLSLHDALPICRRPKTCSPWWYARADGRAATSLVATYAAIASWLERRAVAIVARGRRDRHRDPRAARSEEHTSELQSRRDLVCRLLLEKKNVA